MSQTKPKVPSIIALTNMIEALEAGSAFKALDPTSRAIIKFVGLHNVRGEEVGASEILASLGSLASSVTLLSRIGMLSETGWLKKEQSGLHHRRKSIILTGKAKGEISRLSASLDVALETLVAQR